MAKKGVGEVGDGLKANKVLVLLGSPRKKGNSATLVQSVIKGAQEAGAEVETVYLNGYNIRTCQSCYVCQQPDSKGCSLDDGMQEIFPKLVEADAWVFATPVFWFTFSGQTKLLMDRLFALGAYTDVPFRNKRIAIAMTYGGEDVFSSGCVNALRTFQDAFTYCRAKMVGMVYGTARTTEDITSNKALLQEAEMLGRKLVGVREGVAAS